MSSTQIQAIIATIISGIGMAVVGWGISIMISVDSPFLPWVSLLLVVVGLVLIILGLIWLIVLWLRSGRSRSHFVIRNRDNLFRCIGDYSQLATIRFSKEHNLYELNKVNPNFVHIEAMGQEEDAKQRYYECRKSLISEALASNERARDVVGDYIKSVEDEITQNLERHPSDISNVLNQLTRDALNTLDQPKP